VGTDLVMRLDFRLLVVEARTRITVSFRAGGFGGKQRFSGELRSRLRLRPLEGGTPLTNRRSSGLKPAARFLLRRWFRATDLNYPCGIAVAEAIPPHDATKHPDCRLPFRRRPRRRGASLAWPQAMAPVFLAGVHRDTCDVVSTAKSTAV
jgi:hypothetical protein